MFIKSNKLNIAKKGLIPLLFLTTFVAWAKLGFEYYNFLFPVMLICILIILLRNYKAPKGYKVIFLLALAVNLLCLATPDKTVYKLRNNHHYFWSEEPLGLSHFNIRRNIENDTAAIINPMLIGAISRVYNYPPAILFTSYNKDNSWLDTFQFSNSDEDKKLLEQLLKHEKNHLDITEIYTRKAQDSLYHMILASYDQKYEVVKHYFNLSQKTQKSFDAETDNGTVEYEIDKWNKLIIKKLNKK